MDSLEQVLRALTRLALAGEWTAGAIVARLQSAVQAQRRPRWFGSLAVPPHCAAHAFFPGRSLPGYLAPHARRPPARGRDQSQSPSEHGSLRLRSLKATLFNCGRTGPAAQNRDDHPHFHEHLQGRIAWMRTINPLRAAKLQVLFDHIDWSASAPA